MSMYGCERACMQCRFLHTVTRAKSVSVNNPESNNNKPMFDLPFNFSESDDDDALAHESVRV